MSLSQEDSLPPAKQGIKGPQMEYTLLKKAVCFVSDKLILFTTPMCLAQTQHLKKKLKIEKYALGKKYDQETSASSTFTPAASEREKAKCLRKKLSK